MFQASNYHSLKQNIARCCAAFALSLIPLSGAPDEAFRPSLFLSLPKYANTPDAMALDPQGNVILSCPNFNDTTYPGVLLKIDPQNNVSIYFPAPVHPDTKRGAPMGLEFGPDGNLYYADNQYFSDKDHKSRLIRIILKDGEPVGSEVVVDGFKLSNAVRWKGQRIYVSDTFFDLEDSPGESGIYSFHIDEFKGKPILLEPNARDSHLIARFKTTPNHRNDLAGSDGLAFDNEGRLVTGSFGDGVLYRMTLDENGKVAKQDVITPPFSCADGMVNDPRTGNIYIADSEKNAIQVLALDGTVHTLWENEDSDGSDGLLDQPSEPIIRGNELLIANFDMPFPGLKNKAYDKHHTISVIRLK